MNIFLSIKADKQLKKLPKKMHDFILERILILADNQFPTNSKKLINREGWRIRVGDYRILYSVDKNKKELTILSVSHRKEAYRL